MNAPTPSQAMSKAGKRRGRPKRRTGHNSALRLPNAAKARPITLSDRPQRALHQIIEAETGFAYGQSQAKSIKAVSSAVGGAAGEYFLLLYSHCDMHARKQVGRSSKPLMKPSDQLIAHCAFGLNI